MAELPAAKRLFTPGPLTTSATVRRALPRDLGSRDREFIDIVRDVRQRLLRVAGVSQESGFEAVLMQGSGTFGIEAVVSSCVPRDGKLMVLINGAYGQRIARMARVHGIAHATLERPEDEPIEPHDVDTALARDAAISHVALIHCETTTGLLNPVREIGQVVARHRRRFIVDSMSAFGAIPVDLEHSQIDFLISSSNKCIEGVPGFSFIICRREALLASEGQARTLSLDLYDQWRGLERDGQFRFTPPVQTILAFRQALIELEKEGGVAARGARYARNREILQQGMRDLGFREYLRPELQSYIITSYRYPDHPRFDFNEFYARLAERGFVVYPGKVSRADCFRIGTIGRLFESDVRALLQEIRAVLCEMDCATFVPATVS